MILIRSLPAPAFVMLALIAGCLGGAVYPLAVMLSQSLGQPPPDQAGGTRGPAAGGRLYAADLLGGCLAALMGAAFLVPVLGIPQTSILIAVAAVAGLIASA